MHRRGESGIVAGAGVPFAFERVHDIESFGGTVAPRQDPQGSRRSPGEVGGASAWEPEMSRNEEATG